MASNAENKKSNRLVHERSPYLLQHAYNPVDWYPWGPEAFEKARKDNKMIFLSVGYSTCHWCHVMERESFENPRIGKLMNDAFVNIKVDREERPDVDKFYMTFVQATTGGGGWPMSVWLTPELKPIVGGTYFPPDDSGFGRPGFTTIIKYISEKWRENSDQVRQQGDGLTEAIAGMSRLGVQSATDFPTPECIDKCYKQIADTFDSQWGGFGSAPKFPQPGKLYFLMRYFRVAQGKSEIASQNAWIMQILQKTLTRMSSGGIHDHISQGFHRYSTDRKWHVPHFEKMLYDQGQLAVTFAEMYQITKEEFYAEILRDILTYVNRDMTHPLGGFYSAEDADSYPTEKDTEKKEGAFCVWTYDELKKLLGSPIKDGKDTTKADLFMFHFGCKKEGNVNPQQDPHGELVGKNVLIIYGSLEATANEFKLTPDETKTILNECQKILFEHRGKRPRPHLDTKMLTAWNALMISGCARAASVLHDPAYKDRATSAAEFIRQHLYDEGKSMLLRSCYTEDRKSIIQIPKPIYGFADDYAFFIAALLDLYECSFNDKWLKWASELQTKMDELFWDNQGKCYFQTAVGDPSIIVRMKEDQDGAEPSANSMAVLNLLRLADYLDDPSQKEKAKNILTAFGETLKKYPPALSKMMCGYMYLNSGAGQVIIVGSDNDENTKMMIKTVNEEFTPFKVSILLNGKSDSWLTSKNKHLAELKMIDGKPTAYVCKNFSCSAPTTSIDELKKHLQNH